MKFINPVTVLITILYLIAVTACSTIPKGATAVKPFDQKKYLGRWYEIARFDYKFERNLDNVTANYTLNNDGTIKVVNRGYNYVENVWKESIGKAKPVDDPQEAKLKVSFFGPFYSGYNVIAIDNEYKYALVAGKNTSYLWILSREKTIPQQIRKDYLTKAQVIGFDTTKLVWVKQDKNQ